MGSFPKLIDELGWAGATCVIAIALSVTLFLYVIRRLDDDKPVRWPTRITLLLAVVCAIIAGYIWLARPSEPEVPKVDSPAASAPAATAPATPERSSRTQGKAPAKAVGQRKGEQPPSKVITAAQNPPTERYPGYDCGPPFYLGWYDVSPLAGTGRSTAFQSIPQECRSAISGEGYPTKEAALQAMDKANQCVGPGAPAQAGLDKC